MTSVGDERDDDKNDERVNVERKELENSRERAGERVLSLESAR